MGAAEADWQREVEIKKLDESQNLVFGYLSKVVDADGTAVVDSQGDMIPVDELEKAAYNFMLTSRLADEMHDEKGVGSCVESFVSTPEKRAAMGVAKSDDKTVGWWVGFKVAPEVFAKVKSGERRAFSIGGRAHREAA